MKITKATPPATLGKRHAEPKYPFKVMPAESFFTFKGPRDRIANAANYWAKKKSFKFSVEKIAPDTYRVWRLH